MNTSYDTALREVATQSPSDVAMLDTLSFSHPLAGVFNLVNDRVDLKASYTSGGDVVTYSASSFAFSLPDSSGEGVQNLKITVPNTNGEASNWLDQIPVDNETPIEVIYRVYLSNKPEQYGPLNDPPIKMFIRDIQIDIFTVSAVAVFKSVVNKKYPSEYYTLEKFPSLGN
jgi:hypothetical protein